MPTQTIAYGRAGALGYHSTLRGARRRCRHGCSRRHRRADGGLAGRAGIARGTDSPVPHSRNLCQAHLFLGLDATMVRTCMRTEPERKLYAQRLLYPEMEIRRLKPQHRVYVFRDKSIPKPQR